MNKRLNPFKDKIEIFPDELVLQCKEYYKLKWETELSEMHNKLQSRALRYFDFLILYNRLQKYNAVADEYNENSGNIRSYIMTAYQRVKKFQKLHGDL